MNKIVNNFLSEKHLDELKSIVSYEKNSRILDVQVGDHNEPRSDYSQYAYITDAMGRLTIRDFKVPDHIYNYFVKYLVSELKIDSEQIDSRGAMFCEYSRMYGEPRLSPHYDSGDPTVLLDFQLYSTTSWPIVVDDNEFILNDNDLLAIYPTNQQHWRSNKVFSDIDVVGMIFIMFHIKDLKQEKPDINLLNKRVERWNSEREERK